MLIWLMTYVQMLSYLAYVMRFTGDQDDAYGETLILSALRILQDCPANGIALRKVFMFETNSLPRSPVF